MRYLEYRDIQAFSTIVQLEKSGGIGINHVNIFAGCNLQIYLKGVQCTLWYLISLTANA